MSKKVFIAEQETLLEVQEQVEKLVRNLVNRSFISKICHGI